MYVCIDKSLLVYTRVQQLPCIAVHIAVYFLGLDAAMALHASPLFVTDCARDGAVDGVPCLLKLGTGRIVDASTRPPRLPPSAPGPRDFRPATAAHLLPDGRIRAARPR